MTPERLDAVLVFGKTYWISFGGGGLEGSGDFVYCGSGPHGEYQFVPPVAGAPMLTLFSAEIAEAVAS